MSRSQKVRCWVEWQFFDEDKTKKGFDCDKCHEDTKRLRRCAEDRWDWSIHDGPFPIRIRDGENGYAFCPAKLIRDSPGTSIRCQTMFVRWKAGSLDYDRMDHDEVNRFYLFIRMWEGFEKSRDFKFLSRLLGGDPKK